MNFFNNMCFLCLVHNKNIKSMLLQDDDGIVVEEKLKYILSELANFKPHVPKCICADCLTDLNYVYKFKQKCLKSMLCLTEYFKKQTAESKSTFTESQHYKECQMRAECHTEINETTNKSLKASNEVQIDIKKEQEDGEDIHDDEGMHTENFLEVLIKEEPGYIHQEIDRTCEPLLPKDTLTHDESTDKFQTNTIDFGNAYNDPVRKFDPLLDNETQTDSENDLEDKLKNETTNNAEYMSTLSTGEETNTKLHKCSECPKTFTQKCNLSAHRRTHTGIKPYNCDMCNKAFSQKIHLTLHKRTHTGEKPYKCDVCEKPFNQNSHLIIHRRIHTGEKPYKCDACDKAFSDQTHLTKHKRVHTGEKPYKCDVCDKAFNQKTHLKHHGRIHTGDKPYSCDVCSEAFSRKIHLKEHKRTHKVRKRATLTVNTRKQMNDLKST